VSIKLALERVGSRLCEQGGQEPYLFPADFGEICLSSRCTRICRECDVLICHREGSEVRQIVHAVHDKLLKMPFEMKGGDSRNMIVFFEPSHGDMPRDQIADALCSNSVRIFLIVSQSTFDSIGNLQPGFTGQCSIDSSAHTVRIGA